MDMHYQSRKDEIVRECQDVFAPTVIEVEPSVLGRQEIEKDLDQAGYFVARVDNAPIDKDTLLRALDQACGFPDYFGFNWDALADSLSDFSWQPANGYILIYEHPEKLNEPDLEIFLDIILEVAQIWAGVNTPFKLLVPREAARAWRAHADGKRE